MEDLWELRGLFDEVAPYLRMIFYHSPDMRRVKEGVRKAKEVIESLGRSYYETHLRTVLEAYIMTYENMNKDQLSLEDLLLEKAYPVKTVEVLEEGMAAFLDTREEAWDSAFEVERRGIKEEDAYFGEFPFDVRERILEVWRKLEEYYGEKVEIKLDPHHSDRLMSMVGDGVAIIGYKKLPAYYLTKSKELVLDWRTFLSTLIEEYLHAFHYRKIKDMPPLFVYFFSHSEEIWVKLEVNRVMKKFVDLLEEKERELFELFSRINIGSANTLFKRLRDLYLYSGRIEDLKSLFRVFKAENPDRTDWKMYFEERRKEILSLMTDPTEDMKYYIRISLLLQGKEPPSWWLEKGKISGRAMELLGLL